jgi:molecular chaperone GrpE
MAKKNEDDFLDDIDEIEEEMDELEDVMTEPDLESLVEERDQLQDRLIRAYAELENTRKRADRDRREAELYGGNKLARDLLSVHDNMSRALDAIDDDLRANAGALVEGIELTQRELLNVFEKHHIHVVNPEIGEKFDPKIHQAMFEAPVPNTVKGTIIQVMATGFVVGDRLLRAAQVGVSSNTEKVAEKPED